ncbi:MAG: hypothetical protein K6C94_01245 [Candidatus Gastranaerophilales bacterium]|nr:hypothetical protein [Candidatus Gastranaerophilales bacterium]
MESFTGLNNSIQTSVTLERINDVASSMLAQHAEFKNSAANASEIIENIYKNMEYVSEYFKQTFSARGISTESVYCKREEDIQTILMSVLWEKLSFTLILNDFPSAIIKQDNKKYICHRIVATKGDCSKIIRENPDNYASKLLDAEIASLYVPANKNDLCELRVRYLSNEIHKINQSEAAKEFFLLVLEYTCKSVKLHSEREFSSMFYKN